LFVPKLPLFKRSLDAPLRETISVVIPTTPNLMTRSSSLSHQRAINALAPRAIKPRRETHLKVTRSPWAIRSALQRRLPVNRAGFDEKFLHHLTVVLVI